MKSNFNYSLTRMLEEMNELTNDWQRLSKSEKEHYKELYPFTKDLTLVNKDVQRWLEHHTSSSVK